MPFPSQSFQFPAGDESRLTRTGLDVICVNFINHRTDRIACFVIYRVETGEWRVRQHDVMSTPGMAVEFRPGLVSLDSENSIVVFSSEYDFCCWD